MTPGGIVTTEAVTNGDLQEINKSIKSVEIIPFYDMLLLITIALSGECSVSDETSDRMFV